jgi:hypothetical protein
MALRLALFSSSSKLQLRLYTTSSAGGIAANNHWRDGTQLGTAQRTAAKQCSNGASKATAAAAAVQGAHFEGALLSSSDVGRICENPTLEPDTKRYELGCKATK